MDSVTVLKYGPESLDVVPLEILAVKTTTDRRKRFEVQETQLFHLGGVAPAVGLFISLTDFITAHRLLHKSFVMVYGPV